LGRHASLETERVLLRCLLEASCIAVRWLGSNDVDVDLMVAWDELETYSNTLIDWLIDQTDTITPARLLPYLQGSFSKMIWDGSQICITGSHWWYFMLYSTV
jgi:hypothetical protein